MPEANHYCAECDTHFGSSPNYISPEEHAEMVHEGSIFMGVKNGDWKDWNDPRKILEGNK